MRGTGIAPEQPSQASRWPPCNRADGRLIPTMKRPVVRQKRIDELLLDIAQAGANEHEVHEAAAGAVQTGAASRATSACAAQWKAQHLPKACLQLLIVARKS